MVITLLTVFVSLALFLVAAVLLYYLAIARPNQTSNVLRIIFAVFALILLKLSYSSGQIAYKQLYPEPLPNPADSDPYLNPKMHAPNKAKEPPVWQQE